MNRTRVIGTLLAVILLACVAVIVLDQMGAFGGSQTVRAPTPNSAPNTTPPPGSTSTGDGYGGLK